MPLAYSREPIFAQISRPHLQDRAIIEQDQASPATVRGAILINARAATAAEGVVELPLTVQ